jgi:hypothetical protein
MSKLSLTLIWFALTPAARTHTSQSITLCDLYIRATTSGFLARDGDSRAQVLVFALALQLNRRLRG